MIIRCLVIALLLLIRYVTFWPWPLTFWPWSVIIHGGSRVNPSTKLEDPTAICSWVMSSDISHRIPLTMRLQPLRMRRITWPMRRGLIFARIFEIPDPDFRIHYTTLMSLRLRQMELSAKTMYGPELKITQLSEHAQNHVSIERYRKSFTTVVLGDHDFPWIDSNFGNLTAFDSLTPISL